MEAAQARALKESRSRTVRATAASSANLLIVAVMFVPAYLALDWASFIEPVGPFNITPWNPQPALAIVWMTIAGFAPMPVVFATIVAGEIIIRGTPGGLPMTFAMAGALLLGYSAIAFTLRGVLNGPRLHTARDLAIFFGVVVAVSALAGAGFIGMLAVSGQLGGEPFLDVWLRFWIGDAVGILVTLPLLLSFVDASQRQAIAALARQPAAIIQTLVLIATIVLVLGGASGDPARHFYLLFVPLIWIALRSGFTAAVVATAILQVAVIIEAHRRGIYFSYVELQGLVAALTLTSLFLGVAVDQQRASEEHSANTLRLAAAGEMAGAIAHEVNQPLTAVDNYARAALMVLAKRGEAQATEMIEQVLVEAERASGVVRRLRDFFRSGTTRLEKTEVSDLLQRARRIAEKAIGKEEVSLVVQPPGKLPSVDVDRVQIEVVLRNLVTNAAESLIASNTRQARIEIAAVLLDSERVRLSIADNGPGVPRRQRPTLFQPFSSGKATGMGLGLAMSRAIAEAHGGELEAPDSSHGEFHLILPCSRST